MPGLGLARLCSARRSCSLLLKLSPAQFVTSAVRPLHLKRTAESFRQKMVSPATVVSISQESPAVKRLVLRPSLSDFVFRPGQWVDVFIPGIDVVGGFSLCSSPKQLSSTGTFELAIKASPHPPAKWVSEECKTGDVIEVRVGGDFFFPPAATHGESTSGSSTAGSERQSATSPAPLDYDVLLIGGGVGINPLFSILMDVVRFSGGGGVGNSSAAANGMLSSERTVEEPCVPAVTLLHSAKNPEDVLFRDTLDQLARPHSGSQQRRVHICLTKGDVPADSEPHGITYHKQRVSRQLLGQCVGELRRPNLLCYVCGPPAMIEWTAAELCKLNVPEDRIHYEKWW